MFGKRRVKTKSEPAIAVSIKQNSEFSVSDFLPFALSRPPLPSDKTSQDPSPPLTFSSSIIYPPEKDTHLLSEESSGASEGTKLDHSDEQQSVRAKKTVTQKVDNEPVLNPEHHHSNEDVHSRGNAKESEEEEEAIEPPLSRIMRRKSVFAEAYNPEDEDDESERIIHAKSDEQRVRLGENVKNIFLFRSLDHDQIAEVLDAMFERRVNENEYVIKQGDDGDNFYVIESGTYNIYVETEPGTPPKLVGKYENSGSFGELALMYNLPRAATIQAISEGSLWAMDRQTFRRIVLNAAYKKRKMYEYLLEKVPMLKALQNYERMNLADALVPRMKSAGELIIKQGDAADGMYFVEEGSARVVMVNSDNQEKEISRVKVGGYFGELALVTKKPRAASVYAVDKVRLAFLDVEAFERLLGPCMDIMKRNIEDYENELLRIFGSQANISDIR